LRVLLVTFFIVIADQISKLAVKGFTIPILNLKVNGMYYGESIEIFGDFLKLTFVENPGMAFGIDFGVSSKLFLSLFSVFAAIGILIFLFKVRNEKLLFRLGLSLILAGAIGNLIDRVFYGVIFGYAPLFYGRVVDFLNVDFFDINLFGYSLDRWPIFNIADASVTIGVIILLFFHEKLSVNSDKNLSNDDSEIKQNKSEEISNDSVASEEKNNLVEDSINEPDNRKKIQV